jgi:hypothetical protein
MMEFTRQAISVLHRHHQAYRHRVGHVHDCGVRLGLRAWVRGRLLVLRGADRVRGGVHGQGGGRGRRLAVPVVSGLVRVWGLVRALVRALVWGFARAVQALLHRRWVDHYGRDHHGLVSWLPIRCATCLCYQSG